MHNSQFKCIVLITLIDGLLIPAVSAKRRSSGADAIAYLTVEESKHIGAPFVPRLSASTFNRTKYVRSADAGMNRFDLHHKLVHKYCRDILKKKKKT